MRRPLLIPLALLAVVAAGCGRQAITADQAAVVNGSAITVSQLEPIVAKRKAQPTQPGSPTDGATIARQTLSQLIDLRIATDAALATGSRASGDQIDRQIQQATAQGDNDPLLPERARAEVLVEGVVDKLIPAQTNAQLAARLKAGDRSLIGLHVRHVLVADQATAAAVQQQLAHGGDWKAIAARHSTDPGSRDRGGDLGVLYAGQTVPEFDRAMVALAGQGTCRGKANGACASPVSDPVRTRFGYHVLQVTGLTVPSVDQARQTFDQRRRQAFQTWFAGQVHAAKVTVNPRFGAWDAASGQVVARRTAVQTTVAPGLGQQGAPGAGGQGAAPPTTAP